MPDFRYHLISLISVFLALAIGILLGVAMSDRGVISEQLQGQITSIQRDVARQRQEIDRLRQKTARDEEMLAGISRAVISGSLPGTDVALVVGPYASEEVADEIGSDLSEAGANITSVETLPPPQLSEMTARESTTAEPITALAARYAGIARSVFGPSEEVPDPPEYVVFLGGGRIPPEAPPQTRDALAEAQTLMFEVWRNAGARVVGAESSSSRRSEVPLFREAGIASVDNVDQPEGRAALIRVIATDAEGSYGTKDTASDPFPPPS